MATDHRANNVWKLECRRQTRPKRSRNLPLLSDLAGSGAGDDALRLTEPDFVEIKVRVFRTDMVEDVYDRSSDPGSAAFDRIDVG